MITTKQAAEISGVRPVTIRAWIASGKLPAVRFGRQWIIDPGDLEKVRDARRNNSRIEYTFRSVFRWSDYGSEATGSLPDVAILPNGRRIMCDTETYAMLRAVRKNRNPVVSLCHNLSMRMLDWGDAISMRYGVAGSTAKFLAPPGTRFVRTVSCDTCRTFIREDECGNGLCVAELCAACDAEIRECRNEVECQMAFENEQRKNCGP